jgi:ligand-binding SRPBCC domain-containing protein
MPSFSIVQRFPFPLPAVFDFFRRPGNVTAVAPPELNLTLVEAPATVVLGTFIIIQARRWGLSQRIVTEVVELEEERIIVEEQRQGPFRSWRHERRFGAVAEKETEVSERINYETPGGMLGLFLKPAAVEAELLLAFTYRQERINERLRKGS